MVVVGYFRTGRGVRCPTLWKLVFATVINYADMLLCRCSSKLDVQAAAGEKPSSRPSRHVRPMHAGSKSTGWIEYLENYRT